MLIEHGACINYPDRKGNTAIHLAAIRKDIKTLQIISKAKTPVPDFNGKNFAGKLGVGQAETSAMALGCLDCSNTSGVVLQAHVTVLSLSSTSWPVVLCL